MVGGVALLVELPDARFVGNVVFAVVGENELLAESVLTVRRRICLTSTAPHANEGQQRQQAVVKVRAEPQVGGVLGNGEVVKTVNAAQRRDVPPAREFGLLRSEIHGGVAVQSDLVCGGVGGILGCCSVIRAFSHALHPSSL